MQIIQSLIAVLDSKPAAINPKKERGHRRRGLSGQSLVEIALTTPLLFLMVVSTVEVGLLANNYLILLDAVREGARYAVAQTPLTWNDAQSTRNYYRTACYSTKENPVGSGITGTRGTFDMILGDGDPPHGPTIGGYTANTADLPPYTGQKGLFDGVACEVVVSMQPLYFDVTNNSGNHNPTVNHDDIVVSVIGFAMDKFTNKIRVTGRWPQTNRMCSDDGRDPFNFAGNTPPSPNPPDMLVRGFDITGNMDWEHVDIPVTCIGSQFSVQSGKANDLEVLLNSLPDTTLSASTPNGGMVLVEMTWTHHQLFGFPPLSFLGNPTLYVWSAFPVSAAEPTPTPGPTQAFKN